jgi:predicted amidohydrolase YtcJ
MTRVRNNISRRLFIRRTGGALAAMSVLGCQGEQPGARERTLVFRNGVVFPVDNAFSEHQALAIRGNRVFATGSNDEVEAAVGPGAEIIDLGGRTILPGFIEPHMHFALMAGIGHYTDVGAFQQPTFDSALGALRRVAEAAGEGDWVEARQFDPILLDPPRDLTTRELDEIAPDKPVFVLNASGHIAYVNSRALALAGVTPDTPDPDGAEYGHYEDGTPNGVLYGAGAILPILLLNQNTADRIQTRFVEAGVEVGATASQHGITTLCDQATGGLAGPADLEFYRQMFATERMKARIRASLYNERAADWDASGAQFGDGDALMRVVAWKVVTDGSNQGFTGRQREPYVGTDSMGLYYIDPEELKSLVMTRSAQGWPLALHGNGDAAIDSILDAVEEAERAGIDVRSLRHRIEHCSILHDDQIERIAALGMGPSFLINHVHYWGHVMRDKVFGPEKVQLLDRCESVDRAGITWSIHTDAPVSPFGSLHKIRVAVVRDLWKEPDTILAPDERVSVESAIRAVTINAAWQCHSDHEIGSLQQGKLADFVVLEADPRAVEPETISDIRVSETWMDGQKVYGS